MSIILKGNDSINTLPKAPIANVSNVTFIDNKKGSITIKYTDPNDFILQNVPLVEWSKTVCVYSTSNNITNINSGTKLFESTTRNQYKDNGINVNINPDTLYYFKFFTINKKGIVNESGTIYSFTSKGVSNILKENDWSTIIEVANRGEGQNYWNIGDEIDINLTNGKTLTFQIYDFDHFDKSDGSGKANICFGMKNLMYFERPMNDSGTSLGGWNQCYMRNTVILSEIINIIPLELKNIIKEVNTYAHDPSNYTGPNLLCKDKLFLPGYKELGALGEYVNFENSQKQFPIFTNDKSRIKKYNNGSGNAYTYWTRSPIYDSSTFHPIDENGYADLDRVAYNEYGVCFCFNV